MTEKSISASVHSRTQSLIDRSGIPEDSYKKKFPYRKLKNKKWRGLENSSLLLLEGELITSSELELSANSKSTKANAKRAYMLLNHFRRLHGEPDAMYLTVSSSCLVMNLIAKYCKFGRPDSQKSDGIGSLIQIHLANLGIVSLRARPLTAVVCGHAAKVMYPNSYKCILLHAKFVVRLNLGLRFEEFPDLEMKSLSVTSNCSAMRTTTGVKN